MCSYKAFKSGANSEAHLTLGQGSDGRTGGQEDLLSRSLEKQETVRHHQVPFSLLDRLQVHCPLKLFYFISVLMWPTRSLLSCSHFLLWCLVTNPHLPCAPELLAAHQHVTHTQVLLKMTSY